MGARPAGGVAIRPPQLPAALREERGLAALAAAARERQQALEGLCFRGEQAARADISHVELAGVRLEGCRFTGCTFHRVQFTDVVFDRCDFSGSVFTDSTFCRCVLKNGKGVGMDVRDSVWLHTVLENGNYRMAALSGTRLERVRLAGCDMAEGAVTECRLKFTRFEDCGFSGANFFKTSLRGMDLTGCRIDGLRVSDTAGELKGAVVDMFQAAELARLLGLVIR